ncbi:MAG TPA: hypothetical protein DIT64_08865 [Verrucomicrobiales bacterium]|nr:hypothetical protein [Verrucomicrobiales bacterium]
MGRRSRQRGESGQANATARRFAGEWLHELAGNPHASHEPPQVPAPESSPLPLMGVFPWKKPQLPRQKHVLLRQKHVLPWQKHVHSVRWCAAGIFLRARRRARKWCHCATFFTVPLSWLKTAYDTHHSLPGRRFYGPYGHRLIP